MSSIFPVVIKALFSILILFIFTKLIGCRQMSQLNMFDYINGITIGSIAAELAIAGEGEALPRLTALITYGATAFLLSILTDHSLLLRKWITGKPLTLYAHGTLYRANFQKAHLDLNEFLMLCRNSGYFDLSQIDLILLEPNGKLSIFPVTENRPATPADLNQHVAQEILPVEVIVDGQVLLHNLTAIGYDTEWLDRQLHNRRCSLQQVFLALCTGNGKLQIYPRCMDKPGE